VASVDGVVYPNLPTIYGEIVSDEDCEPGFFWVKGYSQMCPEGEIGSINTCEPARKLSKAEFNQAKADGWP
jgi:hypothetical protein